MEKGEVVFFDCTDTCTMKRMLGKKTEHVMQFAARLGLAYNACGCNTECGNHQRPARLGVYDDRSGTKKAPVLQRLEEGHDAEPREDRAAGGEADPERQADVPRQTAA